MIVEALNSLRPGAEWSLDGTSVSGLVWLDQSQARPTDQEILDEITRLEQERSAMEYQRLRAAEYPNFHDYLDGIVKGDQAQIQAYVDACLAVKAKYPKPGEPE